jgi:tetratricopeptide (TPR) repeat protein
MIYIQVLNLIILCFSLSLKAEEESRENSRQAEARWEAVLETHRLLLRGKKHAEAERLLKEFLTDPALPAPVRQSVLTALAEQIKWGRPDEARQYLDQAMTIPFDNDERRARTAVAAGWVYRIKKQPERALEMWLTVLETPRLHPATYSGTALQAGKVCAELGDRAGARKYFQLAVSKGKEVRYKFDLSEAEKLLRELDNKKQ